MARISKKIKLEIEEEKNENVTQIKKIAPKFERKSWKIREVIS